MSGFGKTSFRRAGEASRSGGGAIERSKRAKKSGAAKTAVPLVRVAGFEPTASWSRTKRATNCATPGYRRFSYYTEISRNVKAYFRKIAGKSVDSAKLFLVYLETGKA